MSFHCGKCVNNLQNGVCMKCSDPRFTYKCAICGKTFTCGGAKRGCSGCSSACGPCCSDYKDGSNEHCWKNMPYYEDWKAGRYHA